MAQSDKIEKQGIYMDVNEFEEFNKEGLSVSPPKLNIFFPFD